VVENDVRYARSCRLALACGAAINWIGALLVLGDTGTIPWDYSPRFVKAIAQLVSAVLGV
jgi:hypothetical protein